MATKPPRFFWVRAPLHYVVHDRQNDDKVVSIHDHRWQAVLATRRLNEGRAGVE